MTGNNTPFIKSLFDEPEVSRMNALTFDQAVLGYELHAAARRLSDRTLSDYRTTFKKFRAHLGRDLPIESITTEHIQRFLAAQTVSKKTIKNYHTGLAALWTWAVKSRILPENIVRQVTVAKPEQRDIIPLTEQDIRALLNALMYSHTYARPGKRPCRHKLTYADRNQAIILLLLDTGLRASELCELRIRDVDLRNKNKSIHIIGGKGDKDRRIPISPRTAQAVWKYLASRPDDRVDDYLILTAGRNQMDRLQLLKLLYASAKRASIPDVHPHRFRHTFAINYLRNGGDIYTLQTILGHSSLEMVRRYLAIAQIDLDQAHRRASPVDNWRL